MNVARIMSASNIYMFVLCLLIILLPFNALINTFFSEKLGIEVLKFWKEALFGLICLGFFASGRYKKVKLDQFWLIGVIFIALVSLYAVFSGGILNFFRVVRLELLPIVSIFVFWLIGQSTGEKEKILKVMMIAGFSSVVLSGLLVIGFGSEFLVTLGYRMDWSTFYTGEALAFCQKIENSDVCRFQGFLSGPNQMGLYMVLMIAVGLEYIKKNLYKIAWALLCFGVIWFTFSRSAMLAGIVLSAGYLAWEFKDCILKNKKIFLGGGLILLGASLLIFSEELFSFFDRPESNSERIKLMTEGWRVWMQDFWFGAGAGQAGPNSRLMADQFVIPENWFLQVAGQFGVVGLSLFVGWYAGLVKKLLSSRSLVGGLMMISVLIPLNLLHSFESAAFVYALGVFIGFQLNEV